MNMQPFDAETQKNLNAWLEGRYDEETKNAIRNLVKDHPEEAIDAFYTKLSFGTAGMRGIMGVGSNRMNRYTIQAATQALANYINKATPEKEGPFSVFIGYDSRHHSREFAEEAARVLAGNKIKVFICKSLRPTPLVSFGCRFTKSIAGIMITASHNPAPYNGYKVYWSDGGQVLPPHDQGIIQEFKAIDDPDQIKQVNDLNHPLIVWVGEEVDNAYLEAIHKRQNYPKDCVNYGKELKIVYTSLYGTGITLMPKALEQWGFSNYAPVKSQEAPNGDFPLLTAPNPEERSALKAGLEQMEQTNADLLIATDPDADRLGVAVKHKGELVMLDGNQIAAILMDHICQGMNEQHTFPKKPGFVKSIVTTELMNAVAKAHGAPCTNVLTGFKYIAKQIREWEQMVDGPAFVFGAEESFGYLSGDQTRDKDAVLAGVLACEAALQAKRKGKSLIDLLDYLYEKYGLFLDKVTSIKYEESKEGKELMAKKMAGLRNEIPQEIAGVPVVVVEDYLSLTWHHLILGQQQHLNFPQADVLVLWLQDGSKIVVRPSGTEPKIKLYVEISDAAHKDRAISEKLAEGKRRLEALVKAASTTLFS